MALAQVFSLGAPGDQTFLGPKAEQAATTVANLAQPMALKATLKWLDMMWLDTKVRVPVLRLLETVA